MYFCIFKKKYTYRSQPTLVLCTMILKLYENNPNMRDVRKVVSILQDGGVVVIPTDSLYAFACSMEHKKAVENIARLKGFSLKQAHYSMICHSISQLSLFVRPIDKDSFSILKDSLPGPYTYIMDANNAVPRNYQNANKTIGLRVPDNPITQVIVEQLGCPLIATSVKRANEEQEAEYLTDPELIHETFASLVDLVVDGGIGDDHPSTVVDLSNGQCELIRQGKGVWPL